MAGARAPAMRGPGSHAKSALALLTDITHREPKRSRMHVEELYELLEDHGDTQLRRAIERAVASARRPPTHRAERKRGAR